MSKKFKKFKKLMKLYLKVQKTMKKFEFLKKNPLEEFKKFVKEVENE